AEELVRLVAEAQAMSHEHSAGLEEFCTACIHYSSFTKLRGTFVESILHKFLDENNRVHSTFNLGVARTDLLSSSDPNLQNVPSDDDDDAVRKGLHFRKMYIAPPGYTLLCPDYSQIELRVLAAISKDEGMCNIYRTGGDIHSETARAIYGLKPKQAIK